LIGVIEVSRFSGLLPDDGQTGSNCCKQANLVLCVILAGCTFGFAKEKADVRDVTGCLAKGDGAREFLLTGNVGSTWEVRSSKVALAEHVGHTITATGVVSNAVMHNMKEDAKEAAKDSGMKERRQRARAFDGHSSKDGQRVL
jgi:hypothetical protein